VINHESLGARPTFWVGGIGLCMCGGEILVIFKQCLYDYVYHSMYNCLLSISNCVTIFMPNKSGLLALGRSDAHAYRLFRAPTQGLHRPERYQHQEEGAAAADA
jgi:hypothetical protein